MQETENLKKFDLIVIGSGPAGYTGAIRAAQLGMRVACVEKSEFLGGTCLNEGCIPSKALLHSSHLYDDCRKSFPKMGIKVNAALDLKQMMTHKDGVVSDLRSGIKSLFQKNKITHLRGTAKITGINEVQVMDKNETTKYQTDKILIATGSASSDLDGVEINHKNILSSKEALELSSVPKSLVVIGGGYIGLELGSVWARLGSDVTIVEYAGNIVPAMDSEISKQLLKILKKQNIKFYTSSKLVSAKDLKNKVKIEIEDAGSAKKTYLESEMLLIAVGRRAYADKLFSDNVGVDLDEKGRINIDQQFRTNIDNIYAVGDVVRGPMLAHKAEEEAVAAVEIMAGQAPHINYNLIPGVIYTNPEVAYVGATEQQLKQGNVEYKIGKFPFMANSRARATSSSEGMVKILAHKATDEIIGAHIIGPDAGTLIAEIVVLMEFKAASEDLARICHAHPTLSEALKEAALAVDKRSINS